MLTTLMPLVISVGCGYTFYYYLTSVLYQNELNASLAYTFNLPAKGNSGPLGSVLLQSWPDFDDFESGTGVVETSSSYLVARLDSLIPICKEIISLEPWVGFMVSIITPGPRTMRVDSSSSTGGTTSRSVSGCRSRSMR